jgi:hypothetical protein
MTNIKTGNLNGDTKLSWTFLDGSTRKAKILDTCAIGKGTYLPGWKWSEHAGKITGKKSESYIGYILSGKITIENLGGEKITLGSGEIFEIAPEHDAWTEGDKPCIALDFQYLK